MANEQPRPNRPSRPQAGNGPFWRLPGPGAGVCFTEFDSKDRGAPARPTAYLWVNRAKQPPGPNRCGEQIQPQLPQRGDPRHSASTMRDGRPSPPATRPSTDSSLLRWKRPASIAARLVPPSGQSATMCAFTPRRRSGACRLQALQALQAERAILFAATRREGAASLPPDRNGRGGAEARRPRRGRGFEPLSLPSRLQVGAGRDAQGLRRRASKQTRARGAWPSATVTAAIYGAGFNSNGRFYATSSETLGMTPNQFRAGAPERRDQIRHRRKLARPGADRRERQGRLRHPVRRRS